MKTRYINWFFVAALAMMGCFMTACEDQPDKYEIADGVPTLKYVRSPLPEEADSLLVGAYLGNTVCLVGDNLRSIYELYFNDQKATLNTSYMTDHTVLVDIPKNIPEEVTNKIYMVTKSGAKVDFDFNVMVPAPVVSSMSCEYASAGSEAVLYGDYFVDDPNVPLTISMPGDITVEGEQITSITKTAVKFIVPEGAVQGNIRVKSIYGTGQSVFQYKVTTKKRNAERYSDRIELQGFQSCFRLFVKPSQSPLKPNQDAATLLVRNHARNGDKRTRITKQGVKD